MYTLEELKQKSLKELKEIGHQIKRLPNEDRRYRQNWIDVLVNVNPPLLQLLEDSPPVSVEQVQEAIEQAAKNSPAVEVDRVQEPIAQAAKTSPPVSVEQVQEAIEQAAKNSPAVEVDQVQEPIAPAAKISLDAESDLNPILTGIGLSDRFLARYAPPQSGIVRFQSDADGQLSLLNFEIEFASEPPDPDDFESLDAFREAIARWDREHPSSSDHCSDLPNSVHSEPPDPEDFDSMFAFWAAYDAWDEASDDDSEPLEVSIDSFCEWAPCPTDWYQPAALLDRAALLDPSKAMELSLVYKNSSTSDFFIPTFGRWGDRPNRSDEPPDTGIFARLPKPKPPTFPPQAANQTQVSPSQPKSIRHPETIPKLSRNYFIASPLAAAPSQPDRLREVMQVSRWFLLI